MRAAATSQYLVANVTITPGQAITPDMLSVASVKLGEAESLYISSAEGVKPGSVARGTIPSGNLISHSNVATEADKNLRVISIALDTPVPSTVAAGSIADVWITEVDNRIDFASDKPLAESSDSTTATGAETGAVTGTDAAAAAPSAAAPDAAGATNTDAATGASPSPTEAAASPAAVPSESGPPSPSSQSNDGSKATQHSATQRVTVTVISVTKSQGLMTGSQVLEVSCKVADVPALIGAISSDAKLTIVAQAAGK
ncbi:SAF domain-containing protein [Micrococcales bacterium 31B]|nr:SAF domain-containing protein [Micrococcales bacterium 31B]